MIEESTIKNLTELGKVNKFYTIETWVVTVIIIGPALNFLFDYSHLIDSEIIDGYGALRLFIFFGLLFSLPTFLIYHLYFKSLTRKLYSSLRIKTVLNIIAILGAFITFQIMGEGVESIVITLYYSIGITISSLLFKIYKK